jgi:anti-sigma B factor antagonist
VFEIKQRQSGDVVILDLGGQLSVGEAEVALRRKVGELLEGGVRAILLNLAAVDSMDSSGLGALVDAHANAEHCGVKLKLFSLTRRTEDLLARTRLLTVFQTFGDEQAAVASFLRQSPGRQADLPRS